MIIHTKMFLNIYWRHSGWCGSTVDINISSRSHVEMLSCDIAKCGIRIRSSGWIYCFLNCSVRFSVRLIVHSYSMKHIITCARIRIVCCGIWLLRNMWLLLLLSCEELIMNEGTLADCIYAEWLQHDGNSIICIFLVWHFHWSSTVPIQYPLLRHVLTLKLLLPSSKLHSQLIQSRMIKDVATRITNFSSLNRRKKMN